MRPARPAARVPELDGIRGLAILLVLIWHYVTGQVAVPPGTLAYTAVWPEVPGRA